MPNRLELEVATDAVKLALETSAGKSVAHTLSNVSEQCQHLLANLPGGINLAEWGKKLTSDYPVVSSLLAKDPMALSSFTGEARGHLPYGESFAQKIDYNGWSNAVELKNDHASAIVVPQTGRIASFKRAGDENVFWQNSVLVGKPPVGTGDWKNFGGDKVWPAPQSNWATITGRGDWPPPKEFDQTPVKVDFHPHGITTTSAINPEFGMRVIRRMTLRDTTLDVTNSFEKIDGKPIEVSVWSVAQLKDPDLIAFHLQKTHEFPDGFKTQMGNGIPSLKLRNDIASFTRDLQQEHKIGTPSNTLLWFGEKSMLRMKSESAADAAAKFPDGGSATEVYMNDKLPYIELETLGPLTKLAAGQRTTHHVRYQLFPTADFSYDLHF